MLKTVRVFGMVEAARRTDGKITSCEMGRRHGVVGVLNHKT